MRVGQRRWSESEGWGGGPAAEGADSDLVVMFGSSTHMRDDGLMDQVRAEHPGAWIMGCSTAGEICDTQVEDDTLILTTVDFDSAGCRGASSTISDPASSYEVGKELAAKLDPNGLVHVLVLSDGLKVNGSELVKGLGEVVPAGVVVTGGLSGDGDRFEETIVVAGDERGSGLIAAVGLYGDTLSVGYGSLGGWDPFGSERLVTRAEGNVLYELDGRSALELYKAYLGEYADGLPATGLLFPLSLNTGGSEPVVRTILSVDDQAGTMTFAGDLPVGSTARLMKANFDRLVDGAAGAARNSMQDRQVPDLAILISCVGRKLLLKQRVEEEVEAVRDVLGVRPRMAGFYSYGEISPFVTSGRCELHNQTMTITTLRED